VLVASRPDGDTLISKSFCSRANTEDLSHAVDSTLAIDAEHLI
jgi:hypothetical protein